MAEIIGYGCMDLLTGERVMYLRSNDGTIDCGTRFPYMAEKIPFGYKPLVDALNKAIDKEAEMNGAGAVTDKKIRRIIASTDAYLRKFSVDLPVRFDIITLVGEKTPFTIEHIEEAFYPPIW